MGKKETYLIVWYDPNSNTVASETITFDEGLMHDYVNNLRNTMGDEFRPDYIKVFIVYDPKTLSGAMQLRFTEEGK